jgi:hypothetical protein
LIVGGSPLTYAETDRLKSEGEFRLAVTLPLAAVIIVLAIEATPLWLLAFIAPVVLARQGMKTLRQSQQMVSATLAHGDANSPAMDALEAALEEWPVIRGLKQSENEGVETTSRVADSDGGRAQDVEPKDRG